MNLGNFQITSYGFFSIMQNTQYIGIIMDGNASMNQFVNRMCLAPPPLHYAHSEKKMAVKLIFNVIIYEKFPLKRCNHQK
jgi:hypothetical protein